MNKVINFTFKRLLFQSNGWVPNWERYKTFLKFRKYKQAQDMIQANVLKERREKNDKILRANNLGKHAWKRR